MTTNLSVRSVDISLSPSLQNIGIVEARATDDTDLYQQKNVECYHSLMNLISSKKPPKTISSKNLPQVTCTSFGEYYSALISSLKIKYCGHLIVF